ncbi:acyl-CoA dehydrogenase family protein [Kroppenstedtia eburnea]|uniref:Acyl-CoA dehydrogenase n=1 Tax=Kroppenstedtia eburnea TaxID=714067 RepID=A0A1N7PCE7_9BACL|nr:acyl-CoA dehydrogenase family protein [Kroppenstedtia eburnea]QKI83353.1 isovaleryl-CoA dehydrogenase [Kroppenstedtia eburnea]SIT08210.1 Acyl-CoA dehydrogenase [Kroppenstedtia eburnea]
MCKRRNIQREVDQAQYGGNNIPRPTVEPNFYLEDFNLQYLMRRYLPASMHQWADRELTHLGARVAGPIDQRAAYTDGEGQPRLVRYNRRGEEISQIVKNEGYLKTVKEVYGAGIVGYLYREVPELGRKAPYLYSYLQGYLLSESEPGFYCPVTLTLSAAHLIDRYGTPAQKETYLTGLTSLDEETLYEGATWLTERQGGSDVGANLTVATADPEAGPGVYRLTGEKFFASNAGAMVATVLARIHPDRPGTRGLGLFLVPWIKPDGTRNRIYVRRLKEKLGVNAVPSAEVILEEAEGYLIGDPDQGFKYMAEALNISRICNAVAATGIMRRAWYEAFHYARERHAFGRPILQYSMVKQTLAEMLMELEVNTGSTFDMIHLFDKVNSGQAAAEEEVMARMLISLIKYRTGEAAKEMTHQAIETLGGNGYIEEYVTPRLLRDAQVLTVWEGTANILALDLWRVIRKFRADEIFLQVMHSEVEGLTHPLSQPFKSDLEGRLRQIRENLTFLKDQPEEILTYHLKPLSDQIVDVYQLVCILKEAEDQAGTDGNGRKFIIAELYRQAHFQSTASDRIRQTRLPDLIHFDDLVDYRKVDVAELQQVKVNTR